MTRYTPQERRLAKAGVPVEHYQKARQLYAEAGLTLGPGYKSGRFYAWRIEGFMPESTGALWLNRWIDIAEAVARPEHYIAEWRAKAQEAAK